MCEFNISQDVGRFKKPIPYTKALLIVRIIIKQLHYHIIIIVLLSSLHSGRTLKNQNTNKVKVDW